MTKLDKLHYVLGSSARKSSVRTKSFCRPKTTIISEEHNKFYNLTKSVRKRVHNQYDQGLNSQVFIKCTPSRILH